MCKNHKSISIVWKDQLNSNIFRIRANCYACNQQHEMLTQILSDIPTNSSTYNAFELLQKQIGKEWIDDNPYYLDILNELTEMSHLVNPNDYFSALIKNGT